VVTDENGEATFFCNGGSVSVWLTYNRRLRKNWS
ncbi:hypothetical protein ACUOFC_51030, partial [Escherichia sp. TWPC-MK]